MGGSYAADRRVRPAVIVRGRGITCGRLRENKALGGSCGEGGEYTCPVAGYRARPAAAEIARGERTAGCGGIVHGRPRGDPRGRPWRVNRAQSRRIRSAAE